MNQRLTRAKSVLAAVVREVRAENVTFMAGSIAYHAFVSLLPFLLLVLFLVSRIGGEELSRDLVAAMVANITPAGGGERAGADLADLLVGAATNATRSAGLSLLSVAALVWATLRIFRGFDQAFSDIYESEAENTLPDQFRDGVVVFGAIGLAVVAVSAVETRLGDPSLGPLGLVARPLVSVVSIAVVLLPMYYVFPDEDVTVREVVPGALVAGVGWTALSTLFRFYAGVSSSEAYGVVGVVILLITWLYFGGLALLAGAAVNAVLAGRSDDVADIGWGGGDAAANDAPFVASLGDLEAADWSGEVRVVAGDTEVTLPPPDEATVRINTVERPALLGGNRETGRIVLRWDSWR